MQTALRPYVTTGIAIVGASIIAAAPVTVPPPDLPAVEVVAVRSMRSVTADVELMGLADALTAALGQAVTSTIDWYTFQIPSRFLGHIAAGEFAHLPLLIAGIPAVSVWTPIAPFLQALMQELPMPIGTVDGMINQAAVLAIEVGLATPLGIGNLIANVFDSGMSPTVALSSSIGLINQAIALSIDAVGKIVAALSGALPIAALAVQEVPNEVQMLTAPEENEPVDDPNVVPHSVNSSDFQAHAETMTLTVDSHARDDADSTEADESKTSAGDGETPNGATDLSDGNKAEPGDTGAEQTGEDDDGSQVGNETTGTGTETDVSSAGATDTGVAEASADSDDTHDAASSGQ
jgi:hypothetical protein